MSRVTDSDLVDFVYREARLLDELRFDDWLQLFSDDGYYWLPLLHDQTDPILQGSLMYEDKLLLRVRIERLRGQRTFSQQPKSRCHHLLQRPEVEQDHPESDPAQGRHVVRTAFHYIESRTDEQQVFAGWATHHLAVTDEGLRIRLKRVDLINCDAAFRNIQMFL